MKRFLIPLFAVLVWAIACNPSEIDSPNSNKRRSVRGFVQKGPFVQGSTISIQPLDSVKLAPNGQTFSTSTHDDLGAFSLESQIPCRYVETTASGYYFNEVTGKISSSPITLRAISDLDESGNSNVNILTTLEAGLVRKLIREGMSITEARAKADSSILAGFGILDKLDESFDKMDLLGSGSRDGILLAISVILQSNRSEGEFSEYYSILSQRISNGEKFKIDPQSYNKAIDVEAIRSNMQARYGTVPSFEQYLDMDGNGLIDKYFLSVSPEETVAEWNQGSVSFTVSASVPYKVGTDASWLSLNYLPDELITADKFDVSIQPNDKTASRSATLWIKTEDEAFHRTVSVIQRPSLDQKLVITRDNFESDDVDLDFKEMAIEGRFSHEETAALLARISGNPHLSLLDLSALDTGDGIIGDETLSDVPSLKTLILPDAATEVRGRLLAPKACVLENLTFGPAVKCLDGGSMKDKWMGGCWRPKSPVLPDTIEELKGYIFDGEWEINSLSVPAHVHIGTGVFVGDIDDLTIGDGCTVEHGAFVSCYLKELRFGKGISFIKGEEGNTDPSNEFALVWCSIDNLILEGDEIPDSFGYGLFLKKVSMNGVKDSLTVGRRALFNVGFVGAFEDIGFLQCLPTLSSLVIKEDGFVFGSFPEYEGNIELDLSKFVRFEVDKKAFSSFKEGTVRLLYAGLYANAPDLDGVTLDMTWKQAALNITEAKCSTLILTLSDEVRQIIRVAHKGLLQVKGGANVMPSLGEYAFADCEKLTRVRLPDGINKIPLGCFKGCCSLTEVTNIPAAGIEIIGQSAFESTALSDINQLISKATEIQRSAFKGCINLTSVTIPEGVTGIVEGTFENCSNLSSVSLSSTVEGVGGLAFAYCNLSSTAFLSGIKALDLSALIGFKGSVLDIPEGVERISGYIRETSAEKLIIPSTCDYVDIKSYSKSATTNPDGWSGDVSQWPKIREIEIKEGGSWKDIGSRISICFCSNLKTLRLPSKVKEIRYLVVSGLKDLYMPLATPPSWDYSDSVSMPFPQIHVPAGSSAAYEADAQWSRFAGYFVED